jgi:thiamine biosynthesis lipoprotein
MRTAQQTSNTITFEAIGTRWVIDLNQALDSAQLLLIEHKIKERIDIFDKTYSRFLDGSLITEISRTTGVHKFPDDAERLFEFYRQLYDVTAGKVTPLVGNLLIEAGYDAQYSLKPIDKFHPVPLWEDTILYAHPLLTVYEPVMLDFGAAGKGYIVDIIGELLLDEGIASYVIDAGADILRKDSNNTKIRVGLGHPIDPTEAIGVAQLGNGSICGSAGNRRKWAGLHHIMDPDTTKPVRDIIATWAMSATALVADGMATALFFTDPARLRAVFPFEYCLIRRDFSFDHSADFPAELFTGVGI